MEYGSLYRIEKSNKRRYQAMRGIFSTAGLLAFLFLGQTAVAPMAYSQTAKAADGQTAEPRSDFQKAHESFLKKNLNESAMEIRKGASYLRKEAESAGIDGKKMLMASAKELDKMADSVEKGAVKSDKKLKGAFSRAERAVADNEYFKATDSWSRKETKETGHALDSAAAHMEQAADWSGRKLTAGASKAVEDGRKVSRKLIEGAEYVPEEVAKALKSMRDAISGFGKKVMPGKK
jgi:hypothetical protein